ncbi:Alpha-1,3/1,6-mannosyltransferase ALG2 [Fusarium keratoplasticum]|uniref:Alpha-1,3/1,6-mannosyltransferase ALG2 n=1 Tax=Fusarium keratoplasticum TaxID=1328300 RepID=A0ACC0RBC1_9HYPO|nr:Alpha-1,3/1,6-mannosyltransferase ALG2 [Fusarium keratoplasticum]KAI8683514.1 Alpha-1,3/1,6-mannosyltransferase ALG2 [Fusarium keratoplasticum]KAI8687635.1 Alpha-1,3/1,6-mannosyltransferase ALG2 [Fusarium keratoplasticum]
MADQKKPAIVFFHPDLGIGGAERLVVDAAVGLQERGHRVVIFTNHCDPKHCFEECRDGTLDVRVRGNWLIPMSILSRLTILCAILRHVHLIFQITLSGELRDLQPHTFIVDQLSAGLPLLRYLDPAVPILFYCHFPDLLLARGRESFIKRLYRRPFDWIEEWSMGYSSAVAVNSGFTKGVVERTWPDLKKHVETVVVYPCVDVEAKEKEDAGEDGGVVFKGEKIILSINRFERKKDIGLAIKAFAAIPEAERKGCRLILAGGYDHRVSENVQYHAELEALASSLSLQHLTAKTLITALSAPADIPVLFLLSIPSSLKNALLRSARVLLYTPANEHFGIVPLEAMLSKTPVLAANSGGPVETVVDGETGWLRSPEDVDAWAEVVREVLRMGDGEVEAMGDKGAARVKELFGREQMSQRLDEIVDDIVSKKQPAPPTGAVNIAGACLVCSLAFVVAGVLSVLSK